MGFAVGAEEVGGKLQRDELIVRDVIVERAGDPVAIVVGRGVVFSTMCIHREAA